MVLTSLAAALRDFRAVWPELLVVHILYRVTALVFLTPLVGAALRGFVAFSGSSVLADQDILFFFLSPVGLVAIVVVVAARIAIDALEISALMTIGLGVIRGARVAVLDAAALTFQHALSILHLVTRLVLRVLLVAAPFLVASALVFWWQLTEHDINFYLSERPPELWTAAGIIGAILLVGAAVLLPRVVSWAYALPIHLFESLRPADAIAASEKRSRGEKRTMMLVLSSWAALSVAVSIAAFTGATIVAGLVVPRAQGSLTLLVVAMGGVVSLFGVVALGVTLFQWSAAALVIARLYSDTDGGDAPAPTHGLRLSLRHVFAGLVVAALLSAIVGYWLVDGVRTDDDVLVIAHRGAAGRAPENTLASIRAAIEDGADLVEIDVQETADGEVVVIHDSDFMKIGGVSSKVWDTTLSDARAIDIGSWFAPEFANERIPTLGEVLALCKGAVRVDIELKYYGYDEQLEQRVVDVVERAGMASDVVVMSLKQEGIRTVRELRPNWTIGLLTATAIGDLARVDADFLAVHTGLAKPRFIRHAHARGKDVYVWTVNDAVHMSRMVSRGVDGLITDEPRLARRVLAERANLSSVERLLLEVALFLGVVPKDPPANEDLE